MAKQRATPEFHHVPRDEAPKTLSDQKALGPVTPLDGGLETLGLIGTQLADAVISTNNGAAFISGRGGYGPLQTTATPLRLSRNRVSMRVAPDAGCRLSRGQDESTGRESLLVSYPDGQICHRITVNGGYVTLVIRSLDVTQDDVPPSQPVEPDFPEGVICLGSLRAARDAWDRWDSGRHLNELMRENGRPRRSHLPHVGNTRAWPVLTQTLTSFISFISDRRIGFARMVPGYGFVQADVTQAPTVSQVGQVLVVQEGDKVFALELNQIGSAWVTRFGPMSQLELYDHSNQAVAILAADPMSNFSDWNTLLASLPRSHHSVSR